MTINPKFELGQGVYMKTDPEQFLRIVTKYVVTTTGIEYEVAMGMMTIICQDIELSETKDVINYM